MPLHRRDWSLKMQSGKWTTDLNAERRFIARLSLERGRLKTRRGKITSYLLLRFLSERGPVEKCCCQQTVSWFSKVCWVESYNFPTNTVISDRIPTNSTYKFPTGKIMNAHNFKFGPIFPENWFSARIFSFLNKTFSTRKRFSDNFPAAQHFAGGEVEENIYPP